MIRRLLNDDAGQDLVEYGLLIGIVTLGAMTAIKAIGAKVNGYFSVLNTALP